MQTESLPRWMLSRILLCFFLSGAAGLIYQVTWGKALGLIFGHTVYAIATVLAVFMGGLALGSACLGRWSERLPNAIALYGWIELGVAATGALSFLGLARVRTFYLANHHAVASSPAMLLAMRFAGAAIVLLLPTFLMGGTLPILVRTLARDFAELGARVSRLYWVNTAGAVTGTLAAGFVFLPAIGLRLTVIFAVGLNLVAGIIALRLGFLTRGASAGPADVAAVPSENNPGRPDRSLLLPLTFAAVGGTAMAYEIGWTRLLATTLGSSTYAFTLMLATFLLGIVLGSRLFEAWVKHAREARISTFALTQTLTALAVLLFLIFFQQLSAVVPPLMRATHETFVGLILAQFVTSAIAMLPAAIVFGFNFPAVTVLFAVRGENGRGHAAAVGRAYAANTLGAIVGATATGFWLVPKFGSFRVLGLAAVVNLLLAVILELHSERRRALRLAAVAVNVAIMTVVLAVLWTGAFYNQSIANFGTVLYWKLFDGHLTVAETAATVDILYAADGLNASISVARTEDYLALRTNGKVDASTGDTSTQLMLGHLGAIFHPSARRVLIIGFGSGMTVSAVARYPEIERIDCVEIEPAVIRAAPYLERLNRGVLQDPRLHIILDDARNFLLTSRDYYDLIISEPSNPWIAGIATLFTEEFYRAAKARLAPGGAFIQWVQAYSLYPDDLRMVFATLLPQFPQVTLWHGNLSDLLLLARGDPAPAAPEQAFLRLDRLHKLWSNAALRADYEKLGLHQPEGLIAYHMLDDADLRRLAAGFAKNTDDHTRLEYRAPRAILTKQLEHTNRALIFQYRSAALPRDLHTDKGYAALLAATETSLDIGENGRIPAWIAELQRQPPTAASEILRGRWELQSNRLAEAKTAFEAALQLDMNSLAAAQALADVARRRGDSGQAELLYRQILARRPEYSPAIEGMAEIERARQRWAEAARWQTLFISATTNAGHLSYARLGELRLRAGDPVGAERAMLTALEREPYGYAPHRNLGELYHLQQRWPEARRHLEFVVRHFPDANAGTYKVLAQVYAASGDAVAASEILRKGSRIFPEDDQLRRVAALH